MLIGYMVQIISLDIGKVNPNKPKFVDVTACFEKTK